jgi:multiple sugar transport system substrate-binding protein
MTSGNQDGAQRPFISTFGLNRRQLVKSALIAGGTIVWAGNGPSNRVAAQDKVKIVQWYHQYGEEGTQDAVNRYAQQFTEANPDITVEVVWQTSPNYGSALSAALLTDDGPDVYEQNSPTLDQVKQNQVAPLDDLYTDEVRADFNEVGLQSGTIDGKIYWVKMIDDTGAFYYRKSQFADAGIEPPATFDELMAAAATLTQGRQKGLFIGNDGGVSAGIGPHVWASGTNYLSDDNTKVTFNTESLAGALTKLKELNDSGSLLIGAPTDYYDPSAFTQQLAAVQWTGLWALPQIMKEVGDDADVFLWPASAPEGKPKTWWGGWGECVNGKSKNIDAAKTLVKWLWIDNTEIQQDWALSYGFHIPPRKSAADSAEQLKSGVAAKFVKFINESAVVTNPLWDAAMGTALTEAMNNVIKNGADPKAELDAAAKTAQAELDRLLKG